MYTRTEYTCGTVALSATSGTAREFCQRIAREAEAAGGAFAYVFHSPEIFSPQDLAAAFRELAPGVPHAGCTTAGEITPAGLVAGNAVAVLLPKRCFSVMATMIRDISSGGMERITGAVERLRLDISQQTVTPDARSFAVCLIDGLCYAEEAITSAIHWGLDDIPLLGGSAGDDMRFKETTVLCNGKAAVDAVVIVLVNTSVPFHIFKTDNFVPTDTKLVVTASDPEQRIVHELNAEAAATEYASAIGMDPHSLGPFSFASHPVVVRVGADYYCRSIQKPNDDGSLSFFCAIDDGIVLTVAKPTGMVETTRAALDDVAKQLNGIDMILGFECTHRRLDAQNRQIARDVSDLYVSNNVIGFATYGEQYRSMHLNQTFTGVAFGHLPDPAKAAE